MVRDRLALHLTDAVGCGVAAVGVVAAAHASEVAVAQGGAAASTLLGSPQRVPAPLAALANGTRCHALDFDDTHEAGICHASAVVAPAALAVGQAGGSSGAQVLDAYARGCEVAVRVATAIADDAYARGFHPTSVCWVFGSTAAAARLTGLGERGTAQALGIAASFASGLLEYLSDGSATKPIHAGWAAQAGVMAVALAEAGAEGPATAIEGRFGLLASHGASTDGAGAVADELGERWEAAAMSLKPFPACHFAHASTWAAAETAAEHRLTPEDFAEIVVRVPPAGEQMVLDPIEAKHRPRTPYDAKFSLPYTVAHRLVYGQLGLGAFSEEAIADPDVLALAARVRPEPISPSDGRPSRFGGGARTITRSGVEHDRSCPMRQGARATRSLPSGRSTSSATTRPWRCPPTTRADWRTASRRSRPRPTWTG